MYSIEVRDATKSYDGKNFVLNGLNLSVQSGSIYSLIGASGCGKTTLLSSILGIRQLDSGSIKILNHEVFYDKHSKFPHLIGYMPQETALVPELTIKETITYFGNIYQMDKDLLRQRLDMICDLLEFRDRNQRIIHLSGGEQRRVSFGAALIHDPKILILDEPTVGLDSILREKIWTFLIESIRSSDKTVVITTHYIAEAEKSNCCGLMRNGMLLAEDSPQNIFRRLEVSNLEEAFYKLCLSKNPKVNDKIASIEEFKIEPSSLIKASSSNEYSGAIKKEETNNFRKREKFSFQVLKALFLKEVYRVKRQSGEMVFTLFLPLAQILCFAFACGKNPIGLKLGVVNHEVTDSNICTEYLKSTNYQFNSTSCYFENLSCYFLNELKDDSAIKVYYNTSDEAYMDTMAGKNSGFLTISSNFTDVISQRKNDWKYITEYTNFTDVDLIQVRLDQSDYTISTFLYIRLLKTYERFNKKVLRHCNLNDKFEDLNLEVSTFYGSIESDFVMTMMPAVFAQILFLAGILFSISCIAQSRMEGMWNRTILAGVTTNEVLAVQFFILTISNVIQVLIFKTIVGLLFDTKLMGNMWLLGAVCIAIYMVGSSMGLLVSILTSNIYVVNSFGIMICLTCGFLGGGNWPVEAQLKYVKIFSIILPTTIPSITIRNIVAKGLSISHYTIYGGILFLIAYIIIFLTLSFLTLRRKKYTS